MSVFKCRLIILKAELLNNVKIVKLTGRGLGCCFLIEYLVKFCSARAFRKSSSYKIGFPSTIYNYSCQYFNTLIYKSKKTKLRACN